MHTDNRIEEQGRFRISMVGTSGAGKTCLLACLYETFQMPREGFTLLAENDRAMDLEDLWEGIESLRPGSAFRIAGTASETDFAFRLCFQGRPVANLHWADYRGGLLDVRAADDADGGSVTALVDQVRGSDAICLVIDATELMAHEPAEAARRIRIRRLQRFFQEFVTGGGASKELVVQVLLTKSEAYLADEAARQELTMRTELLLQKVLALCEECAIPCNITPISVIGPGHELANPPVIRGPVRPFSIEKPLLTAIGGLLAKQRRLVGEMAARETQTLEEIQGLARQTRSEADGHRARMGILDSFVSFLRQKPSASAEVTRLDALLQTAEMRCGELQAVIAEYAARLDRMDQALARLRRAA